MSTKAKLNKLLKTKEDIKKAIQNKGGNVGDVFDEYPAAIKGLESGNINVANNMLSFGYSQFTELPKKFDFSSVKYATSMFAYSNLVNADINFAPIDMTNTFEYCKNLKSVNFDWSNVRYFNNTFSSSGLTEINIEECSPYDVSYMFNNCNIHTIDISNMDMSKANSFSNMLGNVFTLKGDVTIDNHYSSKLTNGAKCLRNIDDNISISTDTSISFIDNYLLSDDSIVKIFNALPVVTSSKIVSFDQTAINNCSDETIAIAVSKGWTVSPAKTISEPIVVDESTVIPNNTYQITPRTYDFSKYTGPLKNSSLLHNNKYCNYFEGEFSAENCRYAFQGNLQNRRCLQVYKIKINNTVKDLGYFLYSAGFTTNYPIYVTFTDDSDFSNVVNFNSMLYVGDYDGYAHPTIDVSNWDVSNAENMFLFNSTGYWNIVGCENWNITNKCKYLPALGSGNETIDLNHWDTSGAVSAEYLFANCKNLKSFNIDQWDISNIRCFYCLFKNCTSLEEVDLSNMEFKINGYREPGQTGSSYEGGWFQGCTNLKKVKLPKVEAAPWENGLGQFNLHYLFTNCSSLESVDLSPINFDKFKDLGYMFSGCTSLKEVKITSKINSNATVINMFKDVTTDGTLYYNPEYDYSKIIAVLPPTWKAVPITE